MNEEQKQPEARNAHQCVNWMYSQPAYWDLSIARISEAAKLVTIKDIFMIGTFAFLSYRIRYHGILTRWTRITGPGNHLEISDIYILGYRVYKSY